MEQKVLRTGALVVACAIVLRLFGSWWGSVPLKFPERMATLLFFMQTGRVVRTEEASFSPPPAPATEPTEAPAAQPAPQPQQKPAGYSLTTLIIVFAAGALIGAAIVAIIDQEK